MNREVILRLGPPSPSLERRLINVIKEDYKITEVVRQNLKGESYTYIKMESKNADA